MAFGDVDGDGDLDLVTSNDGQDRLYRNSGTGVFTDVTTTNMPADNLDGGAVSIRDTDGDGDLDLLLPVPGYGVRLYLNDGTGTFLDATGSRMSAPLPGGTTLAALPAGSHSAMADVDGDGDLDACLSGSSLYLYLNLQRQLDVPVIPRPGHDFELDVYARYGDPSPALAFPVVSPGLAPFVHPQFGAVYLDANGHFPLVPIVIAPATGLGLLTVPLPNDPSLVGISLYTQALIAHQSGFARMTNYEGFEIKP